MKPEDTRDNGAERAYKIEETRGATAELVANGMSTTQYIFIFALLNRISTKHCALCAKMYTRVHYILLKMQFVLNALTKLNQQNHSSREKKIFYYHPWCLPASHGLLNFLFLQSV